MLREILISGARAKRGLRSERAIKVAVASGKGGTDKAFVATNLWRVMPDAAFADAGVAAGGGRSGVLRVLVLG